MDPITTTTQHTRPPTVCAPWSPVRAPASVPPPPVTWSPPGGPCWLSPDAAAASRPWPRRSAAADITSDDDVARIVEAAGPVPTLVNIAGGARGTETVADADLEKWSWMYEVNVLGTVRLTKALLPALRASGRGDVVVVSSVAGHATYEGGGGYAAAKQPSG